MSDKQTKCVSTRFSTTLHYGAARTGHTSQVVSMNSCCRSQSFWAYHLQPQQKPSLLRLSNVCPVFNCPVLVSNFCSWLTGLEPEMIFFCGRQSASRCEALRILRFGPNLWFHSRCVRFSPSGRPSLTSFINEAELLLIWTTMIKLQRLFCMEIARDQQFQKYLSHSQMSWDHILSPSWCFIWTLTWWVNMNSDFIWTISICIWFHTVW